MSWYCPNWTRNLTDPYPNAAFDDGDDWNDIYSDAQCRSFRRPATATVDADDEPYDWEIDDWGDTTCNEHDSTARWDADYDIQDELERAGLFTCTDCQTVYHTEDARLDHNLEDHDEDHGADQPPQSQTWRPPPGFRPRVPTSHSTWAAS